MQLSESLALSRLLEAYDPGVSSLLKSLLHSMTLVTSAQSTTTYEYVGEKLLQEFEVYEAIGPITFRYPGFSLFLCYDLSQSQLPVSGSGRVKAGFGWVSLCCLSCLACESRITTPPDPGLESNIKHFSLKSS